MKYEKCLEVPIIFEAIVSLSKVFLVIISRSKRRINQPKTRLPKYRGFKNFQNQIVLLAKIELFQLLKVRDCTAGHMVEVPLLVVPSSIVCKRSCSMNCEICTTSWGRPRIRVNCKKFQASLKDALGNQCTQPKLDYVFQEVQFTKFFQIRFSIFRIDSNLLGCIVLICNMTNISHIMSESSDDWRPVSITPVKEMLTGEKMGDSCDLYSIFIYKTTTYTGSACFSVDIKSIWGSQDSRNRHSRRSAHRLDSFRDRWFIYFCETMSFYWNWCKSNNAFSEFTIETTATIYQSLLIPERGVFSISNFLQIASNTRSTWKF